MKSVKLEGKMSVWQRIQMIRSAYKIKSMIEKHGHKSFFEKLESIGFQKVESSDGKVCYVKGKSMFTASIKDSNGKMNPIEKLAAKNSPDILENVDEFENLINKSHTHIEVLNCKNREKTDVR